MPWSYLSYLSYRSFPFLTGIVLISVRLAVCFCAPWPYCRGPSKIKMLPFSGQQTRGREHNSRGSTSIYRYLTAPTSQSTIILLHCNGCEGPHQVTGREAFTDELKDVFSMRCLCTFTNRAISEKPLHTYSFLSQLFRINITIAHFL